jgi:hypothetical protein
MKAQSITHNGKTFYFALAQWPARYLKSWALLEGNHLQTNVHTMYFRTKKSLIQFIENNF